MSHRRLRSRDFAGKTVKRVDLRVDNIIKFFFTDGTALAIETESDCMVACDVCVSSKDG